ncbi:MAG: hypothetical protein FWE82_02255 [Defluviitaleaceae bacterium]|nr:hypothetical protein [Defluviitaleaceae bacterium]
MKRYFSKTLIIAAALLFTALPVTAGAKQPYIAEFSISKTTSLPGESIFIDCVTSIEATHVFVRIDTHGNSCVTMLTAMPD